MSDNNSSNDNSEKPTRRLRKGFAAMSPEKQREIASMGGKAAHLKGTAHEFSPEEARIAGRKGGQAAQRRKGALSQIATVPENANEAIDAT